MPIGPISLSDRPTIDCTRLRNSVAQILCADREGAAADWALNATLWATTHQVGESDRTAFEKEQDDWRAALPRLCSLPRLLGPGPIPRGFSQCVLKAFQGRTDLLRSKMSAEGLAETRSSPEQRAAFQQRLIDEGFLQGVADGLYGPMTRDAIKRFQVAHGLQPTGFMPIRVDEANAGSNSDSTTGRQQLSQPPSESPQAPKAAPNAIDPAAWIIQLQQEAELERLRHEQARHPPQAQREESERRLEVRDQRNAQQPPTPANANAQAATSTISVTPKVTPPGQASNLIFDGGFILLLLPLIGLLSWLAWQFHTLRPFGAQQVSDARSAQPRPTGKRLKLLDAQIVAFDDAGVAISDFDSRPEVRMNGEMITLYSSEAGKSLFYSLTKDVRTIELVESKEKLDLNKTAGRVALASIGWSMVLPRKNANVGLGSALLDLRYFGFEKYALAHVRITFNDFTRVTLECDQAQVEILDKLIPEEAGSTKAKKAADKALGLIERMICEGPKHLDELRTRVSDIDAAIKAKTELADHGPSFEARDKAREEIEELREKMMAPRAALYALIAGQAAV